MHSCVAAQVPDVARFTIVITQLGKLVCSIMDEPISLAAISPRTREPTVPRGCITVLLKVSVDAEIGMGGIALLGQVAVARSKSVTRLDIVFLRDGSVVGDRTQNIARFSIHRSSNAGSERGVALDMLVKIDNAARMVGAKRDMEILRGYLILLANSLAGVD